MRHARGGAVLVGVNTRFIEVTPVTDGLSNQSQLRIVSPDHCEIARSDSTVAILTRALGGAMIAETDRLR